ncbi:MAG: biosynthetic-type acetolactate synthase large subunit [Leptospira sp.]|nr:biosynthetic-type acetolactate synthase large subunit [Leptospira sp.]
MEETVAEYIIQFLLSKGITTIPGIPGGTILPIYDALAKSKLRHILARHEQGAGFIAQGMARSTGKVAACLVSSGPGVANLLTAVSDAYSDSVPLLIFSGQVPTNLIGTNAFQELPTKSIVSHFTKANYCITDPSLVPYILEEAYQLAKEGRPGPVWIDLPKDIQNASLDISFFQDLKYKPIELKIDAIPLHETEIMFNAFLNHFDKYLLEANKPLFYIGGGAKKYADQMYDFINQMNIPVVSTLMGLGIFSSHDPLFLGMMGMHGSIEANLALGECDLLIALGVRFDDRATGNIDTFCPQAKIVHIDIDRKEIGKNKIPDLSWLGDIGFFLKNTKLSIENFAKKEPWTNKNRLNENYFSRKTNAKLPIEKFLLSLGELFKKGDFILTDVGQHQMWTAQFFPFPSAKCWITSGGQGTMGFGLPTAIGVAIENTEANVYCITGDGSIMMNIQELATLRELNANVKIIILNNKHLGLVRQQQELFYGDRKSGSLFEFQPNFIALAESFGIPAISCTLGESEEKLISAINEIGPRLIEISIPEGDGVFPFVPGGKSNQEFLLREEVLN